MWKLIGDKGKKLCSSQKVAEGGRIGFQGRVCGLKFATEKPTEFMAAVKNDKAALNAFRVAATGKDTSKILKAARWVMRDLGNPVGWIGSELIISGGITAAMLGEGYTTREAIDGGIAWFLPKSVLKAELHKIRDMAEKEGVDFETLMPFLELESIAEKHDKYRNQLATLPEYGGYRGRYDRQEQINTLQAAIGAENRKYSDLLKKIQKPFGKDDLRYALPYSQLDELRNVADMTQTEKAKANELAALKSQYDRGMQYTRGQGEQISFQDWIHKQGKGDLLFNEFQRGPDRREMLTWGLFHDTGVEPYKMPFPEKAPIDFSAAPYEAGGRVGFKFGGIDKGRRAFMKWLAGITGAGIAAGTGLLKWGAKKGAGTTAIKAGDHIIQGTQGMPDWFIPLINRITKEGDDVTAKLATKEREIVHSKKIEGHDVDVYQDLDTGNIRVEVEGGTGKNLTAYDEGLSLEYKAGEVIEEGKHAGKKTDPEFSTAETEASYVRTGPDDAEIDFQYSDQSIYPRYKYTTGEVIPGRGNQSISDTTFLKNYATKKKPTMGEIVETSKKKKEIKYLKENPHEDPRIPEYTGPDDADDLFDRFGNYIGD